MSKNIKIILGVVAGVIILLALAWYYQQQGLIKIFPTAEERSISQALKVDESKFTFAEGLTQEQKETKLAELYSARDKAENNPQDPTAWFTFGLQKSFFNDHTGAVEAWEITYQLSPDFRTALNLGNEYQYFIKDYPKAEFYYLAAIEFKPDLTSAYQALLDLYHFNLKEKSSEHEAIALKAIEKDPLNATAYYATLVEFYIRPENRDDIKAQEYLAILKGMNAAAAAQLVESYPELE